MAAIEIRTASTKSGTPLFLSFFGAIATWNDERMTRKALNKLSARELDDIGLSRGDIEVIAKGNLIR